MTELMVWQRLSCQTIGPSFFTGRGKMPTGIWRCKNPSDAKKRRHKKSQRRKKRIPDAGFFKNIIFREEALQSG